MADTTTVTTTLDITAIDSEGHSNTFKIDNFRTDVTRAEATSAFMYGANNGAICSTYGLPFVSVKQVAKSTSTKTIMGEDTIYISPSNINAESYSQNTLITTVTVTGATIDEATISNITWTTKPEIITSYPTIRINETILTTTVSLYWNTSEVGVSNGEYEGSAVLILVINNQYYQIPININITVS